MSPPARPGRPTAGLFATRPALLMILLFGALLALLALPASDLAGAWSTASRPQLQPRLGGAAALAGARRALPAAEPDPSLHVRRAPEVLELEAYIDAAPEAAAVGVCHGGASVLPGVPARVCADLRCLWSEALGAGVDMWDRPLAPLANQADAQTRCPRPGGGQTGPPDGAAPPPLVSFVVTMHNHVNVTMQAVLELYRTAHEVPSAEIVVVDDGSTEDAEPIQRLLRALAAYFGARCQYLHNEQPQGYGAANDRGIQAAGGEYIALINSDMFVVRGWLAAVMRAFQQRPAAGIVGPLFFRGGAERGGPLELREAGSILWDDASAGNAGWGERPGHLYSHLRPVDYISAACVVFRKQLYTQLGGFDPRYGKGYYEDADLCMAARQAGHEVLFQPAAVAYHHGGTTFGPDETEPKQSLMAANREVFFDKWRGVLQRDHCRGGRPNEELARRLTSPLVLLLSDSAPDPASSPGSQRVLSAAQTLLAAGYGVTLLPLTGRSVAPPAAAAARQAGIHLLPASPPEGWHLDEPGGRCVYDAALVHAGRDGLAPALALLRQLCPEAPVLVDPGESFDAAAASEGDLQQLEAARLALAASAEQAAQLAARRPRLAVELAPDAAMPDALLKAFTEAGCGPLSAEERSVCRSKRTAHSGPEAAQD